VNHQDLIERLEVLKADLDPHRLSPAEFEQVGWARRPLQALIDQALEEGEAQSLAELRARTATALLREAPASIALGMLRRTQSPSPSGSSTSTGNAPTAEVSP